MSRPEFLGFGDHTFDFDLLVWIEDPTRQHIVRSELNFAIVAAFRAAAIHIPIPQHDLYLRSLAPVQLTDADA